jgi:hypothetical protein
MKINLTDGEIDHIIKLIYDNELDGDYYGNRKQYWERSFLLKQKLLSPAPVDFYCPCCSKKHNNMAFIGFCSKECMNKIKQ